MHKHTPRNVAIVGAGLAGLSAAHTLLRQGQQVTLFEAAPQAGGRARGVPHAETMLDNGQHICLGAYRATLTLLREAGMDPAQVFTRLPLALHMHHGTDRMSLVTPTCLPAPLHLLWALLTARGLTLNSKWRTIRWMLRLKQSVYTLTQDTTVASLLTQGQQTEMATRMLWEPLCLAALNTPIESASAQVFLNVLRDSFQQQRSDSDFLILKSDLSSSLITPLLEKIIALGGKVLMRTPVLAARHESAQCVLEIAHGLHHFDDIILAVGPHQLKTIASDIDIPAFDYQPITTVYLQYPPTTTLPLPMMGLCHGLAQWIFDRGICCDQPGLLAVVISAHGLLPSDKDSLVQQCIAELNQALAGYSMQLAHPLWTQIITEKRATFSCTPDLARPHTITAQPHIHLAGDYVAGRYPATIEGAVMSGIAAAEAVLANA
ncbi:MAG: hydroxysqualene dehydroxylase HpnE [Methylophilus sp.]|uniref:hydroxysqualene dehydroxylase HpnE n=1 Tax=Methylophilus sp. TaxID=29541 RepID=UPI003FA116BE